MRKKNKLPSYMALGIAIVSIVSSQAWSEEAPAQGRVAELALHRLEKLAILKKIEKTFLSQFEKMELAAGEPAYVVTVSQVPSADGSRKSVQILQDATGKSVGFNLLSGGEASNPPVWPDRDAVTLAETSLHCVQGELIENSKNPQSCEAQREALAVFNNQFSGLVLRQENSAAGVIAVVDIRATGTTQILRIRLKPDATLVDEKPVEFVAE